MFAWLCLIGVGCWGVGGQGQELQKVELPLDAEVKPQLHATGLALADGIAFDSTGRMFVGNYRVMGAIGTISRINKASIWRMTAPESQQGSVGGMKVDIQGRLIVADAASGRLLRCAPDGTEPEVLADRYNGQRFKSLAGVALDLRGNIFFTDQQSRNETTGAAFRYDIATKRVTQLVDGLASPKGIAVTPDQKQVCVCESGNGQVITLDLTSDGSVATQAVLCRFPLPPIAGTEEERFAHPTDVIFDAKGRLYVVLWEGQVKVVSIPDAQILRSYPYGGSEALGAHFYKDSLYVAVAGSEAIFRLPVGVPGFPYQQ